MKAAFIAKTPHVQLEAFQFYAKLVWDVIDVDYCKIWLPGLGTEAGELRHFHVDMEISVWIRVRKSLQPLAGLRCGLTAQ